MAFDSMSLHKTIGCKINFVHRYNKIDSLHGTVHTHLKDLAKILKLDK